MLAKSTLFLAAAIAALGASESLAMPKHRAGAAVRAHTSDFAGTPKHPHAVFIGGQYRGQDPDPQIRLALQRSLGQASD
jgi:hypothetical protein